MKTWQFWVIILLIIFVIVPLIAYGLTLNAASKVVASNPQLQNDVIQRGIYRLPIGKPISK